MTETSATILDPLGADFPQHLSQVSALEEALSDALGALLGESDFVDVFFDVEDDGVLLELSFVTQPLELAIPGFSSFLVSIGEAEELELEVAIVLNEAGAKFLLFDAPIFLQCPSKIGRASCRERV